MTTTMAFIVLLVTIIAIIIGLAILLDNSDAYSFLATMLCIVAGVLIFFVFTSEASRTQADFNALMDDRPSCMETAPTSVVCLEEYNDWVKDSVNYRHKLDSIKAAIEISISSHKGLANGSTEH